MGRTKPVATKIVPVPPRPTSANMQARHDAEKLQKTSKITQQEKAVIASKKRKRVDDDEEDDGLQEVVLSRKDATAKYYQLLRCSRNDFSTRFFPKESGNGFKNMASESQLTLLAQLLKSTFAPNLFDDGAKSECSQEFTKFWDDGLVHSTFQGIVHNEKDEKCSLHFLWAKDINPWAHKNDFLLIFIMGPKKNPTKAPMTEDSKTSAVWNYLCRHFPQDFRNPTPNDVIAANGIGGFPLFVTEDNWNKILKDAIESKYQIFTEPATSWKAERMRHLNRMRADAISVRWVRNEPQLVNSTIQYCPKNHIKTIATWTNEFIELVVDREEQVRSIPGWENWVWDPLDPAQKIPYSPQQARERGQPPPPPNPGPKQYEPLNKRHKKNLEEGDNSGNGGEAIGAEDVDDGIVLQPSE